MVWFYGIYRYVNSIWRSINQWRSISMTSQWPLIMTSQWIMTLIGMCIVKSQWVMTLLWTSIVTSQWVNYIAMCTYHGITMHNDFAMNLFYYVFSVLCLIMILLWVVWNKNRNKFMFDQSGLENTFVVFV